jgi:hypothetical protein
MRIIVNARALDRAPSKGRGLKLLYRVERVVGNISGDTEIDTDALAGQDALDFREWMDENPNGWRPAPTPPPAVKDTRPDVVERPASDVPFVDPITQHQRESIRRQIDQQQADARLMQYQIEQGLVDDQHNAMLLRDWLDRNMRGYASSANIDHAIRALRTSLHWKPLSTFTKRLATLG